MHLFFTFKTVFDSIDFLKFRPKSIQEQIVALLVYLLIALGAARGLYFLGLQLHSVVAGAKSNPNLPPKAGQARESGR